MKQAQLFDEWWQEPGMGDQSMEDDHPDFWEDVLENVIDADLTGKKILDFGCNQGGFLRRMYELSKYSAAVGVDLAQKSINEANARKGALPVEYVATSDISGLDRDFDYAVSTAVIYLIDDIVGHAKSMFDRLKPGGVYYATHPDYVTSGKFGKIQESINKFAAVRCAQNDLNAIIEGFETAGFQVHLRRMLPQGYISAHSRKKSWSGISPEDNIELWYNHRYAFKCVKPK